LPGCERTRQHCARVAWRMPPCSARARGDDRPDSDTDIMIEADPKAQIGVYEYVALKDYIAGLFDGKVDVVSREGLKPEVRPAATADAIYAF